MVDKNKLITKQQSQIKNLKNKLNNLHYNYNNTIQKIDLLIKLNQTQHQLIQQLQQNNQSQIIDNLPIIEKLHACFDILSEKYNIDISETMEYKHIINDIK